MKYHIGAYSWDCYIHILDIEYSIDEIIKELESVGCDDYLIKSAISNVSENNSGFCYSNTRRRKTVMVIGKTSSKEQFLNTFFHETSHLVIHIAKTDKINKNEEEFCYLFGEVAGTLSKELLAVCSIKY